MAIESGGEIITQKGRGKKENKNKSALNKSFFPFHFYFFFISFILIISRSTVFVRFLRSAVMAVVGPTVLFFLLGGAPRSRRTGQTAPVGSGANSYQTAASAGEGNGCEPPGSGFYWSQE